MFSCEICEISKTSFFIAHLWWLLLVLLILFVLTLAINRAVLYGNIALSIVVLSNKKLFYRFSKKVFIFQKTCFKVETSKMFKISRNCHIKIHHFLKRRIIFKIPSTAFKRNLRSFCFGFTIKLLKRNVFQS